MGQLNKRQLKLKASIVWFIFLDECMTYDDYIYDHDDYVDNDDDDYEDYDDFSNYGGLFSM